LIPERRKVTNKAVDLGWIDSREDFIPKFKSKPLDKFEDVEVLNK